MNRPIVFGHRGASGYEIENTIPSFQLAVKMNADAVELDAQLTSDEEVIVFHDFSLNRLFNVNKRISELRLIELSQYVFDADRDVRIPSLEDIFKAIGHKITINIELKLEDGKDSKAGLLCKKVYGLIREYDLLKYVIISSFNINALKEVRMLSKDIRLGVLAESINTADESAENSLRFYIMLASELNAGCINMLYSYADKQLISKLHANGLKGNVFTVNNDDLIIELLHNGVDGFFTNYPDRAIAAIQHDIGLNNPGT